MTFLPVLKTSVLFLMLALLSLTSFSDASWREIGISSIREGTEKVSIQVKVSRPIEQIRFELTEGEIHLDKAILHMNKGQKISISIQKDISPEKPSRSLPLTNKQQQTIRSVDAIYKVHQKFPDINNIQIKLMAR